MLSIQGEAAKKDRKETTVLEFNPAPGKIGKILLLFYSKTYITSWYYITIKMDVLNSDQINIHFFSINLAPATTNQQSGESIMWDIQSSYNISVYVYI